jgi:CYTH domain-containing protein
MGTEIERKFLVHADRLPALPPPDELVQGYLSVEPAVRVRLVAPAAGEPRAFLTIKGEGLLTRAEFEYPIPPADARALLRLCGRSLQKKRYRIGRWEIDHFTDRGLWLAEIELAREDEPFERPAFVGPEVTGDAAYANVRLAAVTSPGT